MGETAELETKLWAAVGGRERFIRNFDARTFSPERRADREILDAAGSWAAGVEALRGEHAPPDVIEAWEARFLKLWLVYQASGARVMNWMITGPARFPVERNRKRMETEHKRCDEYLAHATGAKAWARRHARSVEKAVKSAEAATVEHKEKQFPGGRIVLNKPLDRVQLVFEGRPDAATISTLKSRAFRWSPREGAWQRQLTQNGVWAAEFVVAAIVKAQAA